MNENTKLQVNNCFKKREKYKASVLKAFGN